MKRFLHSLAAVLLLSLPFIGFSQVNFFVAPSKANLPKAVEATKNIGKISTVQLDERAMRTYLSSAPLEFYNNGITLPLDIPLPNGKTETFGIVESPILSPERAAEHPDIKTYTGNGLKNKQYIIRLMLSSSGFNAIVLNVEDDAVYFQKYSNESSNLYFSYFSRDAFLPAGAKMEGDGCGVGLSRQSNGAINLGTIAPPQYSPQNNTGANLRTYKFAFAATAEFATAKGGQQNAFNALGEYVNRMTAVFRRDICVQFQLVSGLNAVSTVVGTPYNNGDSGMMLDQCQADLDAKVGSANYDIGHVMGQSSGSGEGLAQAAACDNSAKAKGVSKDGGAPYAQVFFDQTLFHEVGHQFGMSHSFNSSIPVCTTRNAPTSVEPGAGATIMSYGFTCSNGTGDDDYFSSTTTGPILFFHTTNYSEMVTYMTTNVCGTTVATGNTPPTVTVPSNITVPKSTPFSLIGSATDPEDNASLTYSWEGTNIGTEVPDATTLANTAKPPFFRSYEPSATASTRTFPLLSAITGGTNYAKGDKLPSAAIATTHRLSVRDNNASGGGLSFQPVTVTIDGASGPFVVTNDLTGTFAGNSTQTVTWSVNNTDGTNGSAVNVANVKISLSTDGGLTFPTTILASTPNDGSETITMPNVATTTARIKVEAVGNIFFDLSNTNFTISSTVPIELASFTGKIVKNNAQLVWDVKSELNTEGYQIERNLGGKTFETIGFQKAKGAGIYQFEDKTSVWNLGVAYYRLKIKDNDGTFAYSNIIALQSDSDFDKTKLSVFPNPTEGSLLTVILPTATRDLEILDVQGRVVMKTQPNNQSRLQWNIQNLAAGIYILKAQTESGIETVKLVKK